MAAEEKVETEAERKERLLREGVQKLFCARPGRVFTRVGLITTARTRFSFKGKDDNEVEAFVAKHAGLIHHPDGLQAPVVKAPVHWRDIRGPWRGATCPRCGGPSSVSGRHARTSRGHAMEECDAQMAEGILKM